MIHFAFSVLVLVSVVAGQVPPPCYSCAQQTAVVGCTANCPVPQAPRQIELKCEDGFILQNGICVRKLDLSCPPGSRLEGNQCIIVRTESPICPIGSELRDGRCIRIFDHVCPFGFNMVNGQCVRSETVPVSCPPGSFLQNNECVKVECPVGYNLENGWCVAPKQQVEITPVNPPCKVSCPSGYFYQNNACWPSQPVTTVPINPQPPQTVCPPIMPPAPQIVVQTPQVIVPSPPQVVVPPPPVVQPPPQVICSSGYTLRNKECIREEIDCPPGTILRGDKCERISCPPPSTWNGQYCVHYISQSGNTSTTNLVNNTHVVHNFNNVTHDTNVNVNNVNNVYIYKGGEVVKVSNGTSPPQVHTTVIHEPSPPAPMSPPSTPCCTVVTPRICKQSNMKWRCFNRKYQRCGSFCTQPVIQLRPTQPLYQNQVLVMPPRPPIEPSCGSSGCGGPVNCSGCQNGGYCSPSCYQYSCGESCAYEDQMSFCQQNSGPGCEEQDGCYM